jgi:ribonuclease P protein component
MIARKHRFHGHGSLRYVYQHGKVVRGAFSSLKFVPNPKRSSYRLAVVVSKKVSKSAVVRNRIRRRLYEEMRRQSDSIKEPHDMVLTVFSEQAAEISPDEITKLVADHLKASKIIH